MTHIRILFGESGQADRAQELLQAMSARSRWPVDIFLDALQAGQPVNEVGAQMAQAINQAIEQWERKIAACRDLSARSIWLEETLQQLRANPLNNRLWTAEQSLQESQAYVQKLESSLAQAQNALKSHQHQYQQEINRLQEEIKALNRLLSQQHLQLMELTGGEE